MATPRQNGQMGEPADVRPEEPILPPKATALAKTQLALLVSGALVALAVLRVFLFSRADLSTTLAILSAANRGLLLISTALSVAGYAVVATILFPMGRRAWRSWAAQGGLVGPRRAPTYAYGVAFVLGTGVAVPVAASLSVNGIIAIAVLGACAAVVMLVRRRFPRLRETSSVVGDEAGVPLLRTSALIALLSLGLLALTAPWLPAEQLTTHGRLVTGWVIGAQTDRLLVVTVDRQPVWVPVEDITDRVFCGTVNAPAEWPQMSISELVGLDRDRCDWDPPPGSPVS